LKILGVVVFLLSASFAHADVKAIEAKFKSCAENAVSTYEQNECADQAYKAADSELNKVYSGIRSSLLKGSADAMEKENNQESLKRLVASEKAWIPFRDANCSLEGVEMLGGSGEGPVVGNCLVETTLERIKFLQSIF
jgi:uncharacterized protein YecT (DUF1311 family)